MAIVIITPTSSSSSTHLIHKFLRLPKPPVSLFLKPFTFSASISLRNKSQFQPFSSLNEQLLEQDEEEDEVESEVGLEEEEEDKTEKMKSKARVSGLKLTIKEKKELASYAHSLGEKLKCQLVGKSGVTDSVVFSFLETLEKNELLKVKIRKTSPGEFEDEVRHLEEATGSVAVGQIGRTVILYRPSPTKMKAEAKKKEVERLSINRRQRFQSSRLTRPYRREYSERPDGRGRRGESRVATN